MFPTVVFVVDVDANDTWNSGNKENDSEQTVSSEQ
jgi:hypothetical protein